MREHDGLRLRDRHPGAQAGGLALGRRRGCVAGAKAHRPDPGHVLHDGRGLLVLADQQHVAGARLGIAGADDEVDERRPAPGQAALRHPQLGVAERDHGVVALVADRLAPRSAGELERPARLRRDRLGVGGEQQRRLDVRRVGVRIADQARVSRVVGVGGQLELGEREQPVARRQVGQRRVGLRLRAQADQHPRRRPGGGCDRQRLEQLRLVLGRADLDRASGRLRVRELAGALAARRRRAVRPRAAALSALGRHPRSGPGRRAGRLPPPRAGGSASRAVLLRAGASLVPAAATPLRAAGPRAIPCPRLGPRARGRPRLVRGRRRVRGPPPAPAAAPPLASAPRPRHQPLPKIIATLGSAGSTLSVTASPVANGADG